MIQWQGLVPSRDAVREILAASANVGGSFLTVMKMMGNRDSAGILSFSGSGVTLALDFPWSREVIEKLPRLDDIVAAAGAVCIRRRTHVCRAVISANTFRNGRTFCRSSIRGSVHRSGGA